MIRKLRGASNMRFLGHRWSGGAPLDDLQRLEDFTRKLADTATDVELADWVTSQRIWSPRISQFQRQRRRARLALTVLLVSRPSSAAESVAQSVGTVVQHRRGDPFPQLPSDSDAVVVCVGQGKELRTRLRDWKSYADRNDFQLNVIVLDGFLRALLRNFRAYDLSRLGVEEVARSIQDELGGIDPRAISNALRSSAIAASNGVCELCGNPLPLDQTGIEIDHIVPVLQGGLPTRENLRAVHTRCNRQRPRRRTLEPVSGQ